MASSQVAEVLNASRALAIKGEVHEAVAQLLRKRHELQTQATQLADARDENGGSGQRSRSTPHDKQAKALASAIEIINARVQPLLNDLRSNAYKALGVNAGAEVADAKRAYRKLALRFHPDKSEGTTDLFHCIQEAFERFQAGGTLVKPQQTQTNSSFSERFRGRQRQNSSQPGRRSRTGASSSSSSSTSSSSASGPLQTPKNLRMIDHSSASVTVCWDPPPGATPSQVSCYELQFKEADERDWHSASNSLSRTSCQKHNLKPATTYRFRIRALSAQTGEWSPFSGSVTASTMAAVPARPRIISVSTKANLGTFNIVWESGASTGGGSSRYVLEFRPKKAFSAWIEVENSNEYEAASCTRILRDLSFVRAYEFRVRAKNQVGAGPWSSTAAYEPPLSAARTRAKGKLNVVRVKALPRKESRREEEPAHASWSTWDECFRCDNQAEESTFSG
ncbi:Fibronectin type III domain-containing protein 3B [Hondaea fermentalgiana]|uniref:Fibronectin type III domain-containing protein 3B n=1 Tax=Hondaea fermentalgiana TaxID=2315210 RepID=A0A2R5G8P2_9STRA|nr:Fibronectin type III domain-containing protein 3B [Hondaea fermentalgiana]|eukprot:GBG27422.1 Fibronectin type III domain-containing protein 3B [Hondaea fermentalgiana]